LAVPPGTISSAQEDRSFIEIERQSDRVARLAHNVALGYLRGFLVVLVVAHHSVLAYINLPMLQAKSLLPQPRYWRAFMVIDHRHSTAFTVFTSFNDIYFMSLMFFVSGLFVWSSLQRKGNAGFIRDRVRRLGIPFLFAAVVVTPIAYYVPYLLTTGAHSVAGYVHDWLAFGDWPTGPAWFIWLLLAFDLAAAALFALAPNFAEMLGGLAQKRGSIQCDSFCCSSRLPRRHTFRCLSSSTARTEPASDRSSSRPCACFITRFIFSRESALVPTGSSAVCSRRTGSWRGIGGAGRFGWSSRFC